MDQLYNNVYDKWNYLPWKHFMNPLDQWKILPTFLIGEYLFFVMSLLTLLHAIRQGRQHIFVWIMAFLAGSANDIFFMYLPLVDNFWQAQATVMITPRLPLYIPCVYNIFMYCSTVTVWRLGLPKIAEACLTGILGEALYSVYDIIGIKFLWWTWHDTDPPISQRLLGVPIGSSLWVITFTMTFSFILRTFYLDWKRSSLLSGMFVCLLSTPLMMVQMALLQLISGEKQGVPSLNSLSVALLGYILLIVFLWRRRNLLRHPMGSRIIRNADTLLNIALLGYYCVLIGVMTWGKPEQHRSPGIHQTYGQCGVEQADFSGQLRHKYVCAKDLDEDWDFSCTKSLPSLDSDWFTVCGRAHTNRPLWLGAVVTLSSIGSILYTSILRRSGKRLKSQ